MKTFQEFISEGEGDYEVSYTDANYKTVKKVFKNDPQGAPENALKAARAHEQSISKKHAAHPTGLVRGSINVRHLG